MITMLLPLTAAAGTPFTMYGKLEFEADYLAATQVGEVPTGRSGLPFLRICAFDRDKGDDYGVDFKYTDYALDDGNDDYLGCTRADADGNYELDIVWDDSDEEAPDIYPQTKLCDGDYTGHGSSSPAEICVRLNAEEGSESRPENLKVIWSRVAQDVDVSKDIQLSWNLSCPNDAGLGLASVSCAAVTPDNWDDPADEWCACDASKAWKTCVNNVDCTTGTCSDTNSRTGCNKEAVHAYRAAIEPQLTFDSNRPSKGNTFQQGGYACEYSSNDSFCDDAECQDEIQVHLARLQDVDLSGRCDPTTVHNGAKDFDQTCIITPLNPFRVVHEQGHVVDMRWKCDKTGHDGKEDRKKTREGFANFYSVSSWFSASDTDPQYCADKSCWDVEAGSCPGGEKDVTRFLWDLHDDVAADTESDTVSYSAKKVRNLLSAFWSETTGSAGDPLYAAGGSREVDEGAYGSNGANILDYVFWWDEQHGTTEAFCEVLLDTCVDGQTDSLLSGDLLDICP